MEVRVFQRKPLAFVAQQVERRSEEPGVASSILAEGITAAARCRVIESISVSFNWQDNGL